MGQKEKRLAGFTWREGGWNRGGEGDLDRQFKKGNAIADKSSQNQDVEYEWGPTGRNH